MNINEILAQTGGLQAMAKELGISEADAANGAQALAPAILGGFKKQAQAQPGGFAGLGDLIGQLGGGGLLDNVLSPQPTEVSRGNDVLGQIFGTKDVSRTVAENAAARTGLDPALLKRMLPIVAMMVTGFIAKQQGEREAQGAPAQLEPRSAVCSAAPAAARRVSPAWRRCSIWTGMATRSTICCGWPVAADARRYPNEG